MSCECPRGGGNAKCARHNVVKSEHWRSLCAQGGDYYQAWEEGRGPGQIAVPRGAAGAEAAPCRSCGEGVELPVPSGPIDALFHFRHSRHGDTELRYALRGIAKHMPWVRRVVIFGDKPAFLAGEDQGVYHVPHERLAWLGPYKTPLTNHLLMFHLCAFIPELAEDFLWFCDDFVPIADTTPAEACRPYYLNDLAKAKRPDAGHLWRDQLWRSYDLLRRKKLPGLNYETHAPTYMRKRWVTDAVREFKDQMTEDRFYGPIGPSTILNHAAKTQRFKPVPLAAAGGKAAWYGDNAPAYEQVVSAANGRRSMNFDDSSFSVGVRRWLRETFPAPCKFEKHPEPRGVLHRSHAIKGWFDPDFEACYRAAAYAAQDGAVLVELGSFLGKSTAYLATELLNAGLRTELTAVDTWRGTPGRMKQADYYPAFTKNLRGGDADLFEIVRPLRCDSAEAAGAFPDRSVDFLYIDADHSYARVKADIAAWRPKCRGVIAGHDYDPVRFPGVVKAVTEAFGPVVVRGTTWAVRIDETAAFDSGEFLAQFEVGKPVAA